jgi:hypothetical protein
LPDLRRSIGAVETLDPSEKPSAALATLVTVEAMACFGCSQPVGTTPRQLRTGQWVAECEACGLTNKLLQDAEHPEKFSVSGALIPIQRDEQN